MKRHDKEYIHGQLAVEAGRIQGIFPDSQTTWKVHEENSVKLATRNIDSTLDNWRHQLSQSSLDEKIRIFFLTTWKAIQIHLGSPSQSYGDH